MEDKPAQREAKLTKQCKCRWNGTNLIHEQPCGASKENRPRCGERSRVATLAGSRAQCTKSFSRSSNPNRNLPLSFSKSKVQGPRTQVDGERFKITTRIKGKRK